MPWPFFQKSAAVLGGESVEASPSPHSRFAFRLFRELLRADETSNVFFSPSSVMLCLTLVHELASGETRRSMAKALEISDLDHVGIETEITSLKSAFSDHTDVELSLANALFLGRHAQIPAALQEQLRALYDAELRGLDFSSPEAIMTINAWVKAKIGRQDPGNCHATLASRGGGRTKCDLSQEPLAEAFREGNDSRQTFPHFIRGAKASADDNAERNLPILRRWTDSAGSTPLSRQHIDVRRVTVGNN